MLSVYMDIPKYLHHDCLVFDLVDRPNKTKELEHLVNKFLNKKGSLTDYQESLRKVIDLLGECGYFLGPFDYDSEKEYWGGNSYMWNPPYTDAQQKMLEKELHLISKYPEGVRLFWGNDEGPEY